MNNFERQMLSEELLHVTALDNSAAAKSLFTPKYPSARISGFSKSKNVRKFRFGTDDVMIDELEWVAVQAVVAGKLPKTTVDRQWTVSCDKDGLVTFRSNRNGHAGTVESKTLLQKLG